MSETYLQNGGYDLTYMCGHFLKCCQQIDHLKCADLSDIGGHVSLFPNHLFTDRGELLASSADPDETPLFSGVASGPELFACVPFMDI